MYMFFLHADDLTNLDIANGQCYNQSIAQNLTFGYQGLPGASTSAVNGSANHTGAAGSALSKESSGLQNLGLLALSLFAGFFVML